MASMSLNVATSQCEGSVGVCACVCVCVCERERERERERKRESACEVLRKSGRLIFASVDFQSGNEKKNVLPIFPSSAQSYKTIIPVIRNTLFSS